MAVLIAFLRGINVGGRNLVKMADLLRLLEDYGHSGAKSLLQSGNLVFEAARPSALAALEKLLEIETATRLRASVQYMIRTSKELEKIAAANPFPKEAKSDPSHLLVMFLKQAAQPRDVEAVQLANKGPELIRAAGRELYLFYPEGIGRSKLTNALIERKLGTSGTARNWNTLQKLLALAKQAGTS